MRITTILVLFLTTVFAGIGQSNSTLDSIEKILTDKDISIEDKAGEALEYLSLKATQGFEDEDLDFIQSIQGTFRQNLSDSLSILLSSWKAGYFLQKNELDSASRLFQSILDFAVEANKQSLIPIVFKNLEQCAEFQNNSGNFKAFFLETLKQCEKKIEDQKVLANCYMGRARDFATLGNYPESALLYQKALNIYTALNGSDVEVSTIMFGLGYAYKNLSRNELSEKYYKKSIEGFKKLGLTSDLQYVYMCMMYTQIELAKPNTAIAYIDSAIAINELAGAEMSLAMNRIAKATIYRTIGKPEIALELQKQSLTHFEENPPSLTWIAYLHGELGNSYLDLGQFRKALRHGQLALSISKGFLKETAEGYEVIYQSWEGLNNYPEAFKSYKKYISLRDSMSNSEKTAMVTRLELENQFNQERFADSLAVTEAKLQREIEFQSEINKQKGRRNFAIGSGVFILLLAFGLYNRLRFTRKARDLIKHEQERSDKLLLNILPAEIANELKEKGQADARHFENVNILFTDFVSFTETSEKLSPAELVAEINVCFKAFDQIMEKYGIEKIKTIGDAYMAVGGLPISSPDSVTNTILAAIEMQDFITDRLTKQIAQNKIAFKMRAGIHTGPVVAGIVGVKKFQYDIWGDTVNTASRIESNGKPGKVNISQDTYELIKNDSKFLFESRGSIDVKGKGEIEMWFVERG